MYNMQISIFGFKVNLEILILIGIIYLILVGHICYGCCKFNLMEGFDGSGNVATDISNNTIRDQIKSKLTIAQNNLATQSTAGGPTTSTTTSTTTEGFTGANTNLGNSSPYDLTDDSQINTSMWNAPNMTVVPGQPLSSGVQDFLARPKQPIPLPKDELFMFSSTDFKPECCPNTYSNSSGCACMTGDQFNYLKTRGGNNVPYSEY